MAIGTVLEGDICEGMFFVFKWLGDKKWVLWCYTPPIVETSENWKMARFFWWQTCSFPYLQIEWPVRMFEENLIFKILMPKQVKSTPFRCRSNSISTGFIYFSEGNKGAIFHEDMLVSILLNGKHTISNIKFLEISEFSIHGNTWFVRLRCITILVILATKITSFVQSLCSLL